MATDVKKHTTIAAGEKPTRAALAAGFLSVNDVIPVASSTEATQLVVALAAQGQSIATYPVVVSRADARGMHRTEICYDPAGLVWAPLSGVLTFGTKSAADSWAASSGGLLTVGDECRVGASRYTWTGSAWRPAIPRFVARGGNTQNAPGGGGWGVVAQAFTSPQVNDLGTWDAPNGALTIAQGGWYDLIGSVTYTASNTPGAVQITKNSASPDGATTTIAATQIGGGGIALSAVTSHQLAAGDVIRILTYFAVGAAISNTLRGAELSLKLAA